MKRFLLISLFALFVSCGGNDDIFYVEPSVVYPIDEIGGSWIMDKYVSNGATQSICSSTFDLSADLYKLVLVMKDNGSPIPTDCLEPNDYVYTDIKIVGNVITGLIQCNNVPCDRIDIIKYTLIEDELILFRLNAETYLEASQRFHFFRN